MDVGWKESMLHIYIRHSDKLLSLVLETDPELLAPPAFDSELF